MLFHTNGNKNDWQAMVVIDIDDISMVGFELPWTDISCILLYSLVYKL